jgi:lipoprotein-releasing system permease protein
VQFESFVALRFLKRQSVSRFLSFMTSVAIGSVAIGTAALIITFTILDGFERELRTNIVGFSAHIQVGTFRNQIVNDEAGETRLRIERTAGVARVGEYLQSEAVVIAGDNIDGVKLKGLAPQRDVTFLRDRIVEGRYDITDSAGMPSLIIGRRLAVKFGLKPGDKCVLLGVGDINDLMNSTKMQFVVRGIYETGMAEYFDDVFFFTSIQAAQQLFASPGSVNGYDVMCGNTEEIESTTDRIQAELGYPFDPRSVFAIYANFFVWVDLQRELIPVVVGSLVIIAVFNIMSTLLLFVIEKTQAIGVLLSLGATRKAIRRMFVLQGIFIGLIGSLIGAGLAFMLCFAQQEFRFFSLPQDVYYMTTVPIHMTVPVFGLVIAGALALTFICSFVPAWLGSRVHPITSIRFR